MKEQEVITADHKKQLDEDGYCVVRGLYTQGETHNYYQRRSSGAQHS